MAASINRGNGTLGLLIKDPAVYNQANAALANLQEMTRRINAGEGSLGQLLKDDELAKSLSPRARISSRSPGACSRGEGTAGKLLTDKELYDRFNSMRCGSTASRANSRRDREAPGSCCTTSSCMRT